MIVIETFGRDSAPATPIRIDTSRSNCRDRAALIVVPAVIAPRR
jgi:hypothetical protein